MQSQEEFDNNISQMQVIQRQIQEENVKMTAQIRELYESCRENRIAATETRTGASEALAIAIQAREARFLG